jgi:hypothetical protein
MEDDEPNSSRNVFMTPVPHDLRIEILDRLDCTLPLIGSS